MVKYVVKRDGRLVDFNNQKIVAAILKAMDVTETGEDIVLAAKIADTISKKETERMGVEEIQDCVEFELMKSPRKEVAKKYIAYRNQRNLARKAKTCEIFKEIIDAQANDITRENANMISRRARRIETCQKNRNGSCPGLYFHGDRAERNAWRSGNSGI